MPFVLTKTGECSSLVVPGPGYETNRRLPYSTWLGMGLEEEGWRERKHEDKGKNNP